ncbi:MAG: DUF2282 domain-containing protein [Alphaproteobacteria bacterium]|jgi:uncharacterized membrane protein|nr:DUF2282 domain-containing protein [Alphaproteobacteria bacterium]
MIKSALRAAIAAAITLTPGAVLADDKGKCYGVAKAEHNDCAAKDNSHTCAAQAKKDYDANDWVSMSKTDCEKDPKNKGWEEAKK